MLVADLARGRTSKPLWEAARGPHHPGALLWPARRPRARAENAPQAGRGALIPPLCSDRRRAGTRTSHLRVPRGRGRGRAEDWQAVGAPSTGTGPTAMVARAPSSDPDKIEGRKKGVKQAGRETQTGWATSPRQEGAGRAGLSARHRQGSRPEPSARRHRVPPRPRGTASADPKADKPRQEKRPTPPPPPRAGTPKAIDLAILRSDGAPASSPGRGSTTPKDSLRALTSPARRPQPWEARARWAGAALSASRRAGRLLRPHRRRPPQSRHGNTAVGPRPPPAAPW